MARSGRGLLAGHMAKAWRQVRENLRLVDVVLEVADARLPQATRNPLLDEALAGKPRILVLARADLAPEEATRRWVAHFRSRGLPAVPVDAVTGRGAERLLRAVAEAVPAPMGRPPRAMVVGIPNVGKSSLINRLAGGARTRTGARPGVTRGKQWVRAGDIQLLDLPGILPPHARTPRGLRLLAVAGAVGPEVVPSADAALELIERLRRAAPRELELAYGLESEEGEPLAVLEAIGRRRGCLGAGGRVDLERAGDALLKDFRLGRLGRVALEEPPEGPGSAGAGGPDGGEGEGGGDQGAR